MGGGASTAGAVDPLSLLKIAAKSSDSADAESDEGVEDAPEPLAGADSPPVGAEVPALLGASPPPDGAEEVSTPSGDLNALYRSSSLFIFELHTICRRRTANLFFRGYSSTHYVPRYN